MDDATEKAIYNLMQNIIDKLDTIQKDIITKSEPDVEDKFKKVASELKELIFKSIKAQKDFIKESQNTAVHHITQSIEENKAIPSVNNYKEYSLLGSKSNFKPKSIAWLFIGLVFIWSSVKHLPDYFMEYSELKKDKKNYELFYEFVFLNEFQNAKNITADKRLEDIQNRDSLFLNEYERLSKTYKKEMKRRELQKQLNQLNQ